ncbi:MAG: flagellar hook basal-body protein [Candidatus Margulisbacteria bacterium]|jgi:flagellar basal body rod protein FlgG|nr:flagellar hook basal-body protein [Candidatus Margulisiibacteriota bacterium]
MTDRILEIGSAGLESTDQQVKKLMDNLVNAEVPGYKRSEVVVKGFPAALESASQKFQPVKPQADTTFYSELPGALIKTGGALDVAIGSAGYFVVSGQWGEGYTRDGRFKLDNDGRLLTVAGNYPVQGEMGPIIVTPGTVVEINQEGDVLVDQVKVDRLKLVQPEQPGGLEQLSGSLFKRQDGTVVMQPIDNPRVIQGYVESSNVNPVDAMMQMIVLERQYSLNGKVVSTRDGNLGRAMELGRPTQ